jgi:hypothetical protein
MNHGGELGWLEEPPWWKKTLKWLGWLALSIVAAAGLSNIDEVAGFFGFVSVWIFRNRLPKKESVFVYTSLGFTLFGVGLAMANLFGHGDDPFWKGVIICFGFIGGVVVFPLVRHYKNRIDYLEVEVENMEFDWYRKQRFERQQKEYADWVEKNPGKSDDSFRFKKHSF